MKAVILILAGVCTYLVCSLNPAIELSKLIYHADIRSLGSCNPGFTNFKRVFGNKWAWWVLLLDLLKSAVCVGLFSFIYGRAGGETQFCAAFTGLFAMIGHAFPVWYSFSGGKGFLVYMSVIWFVDWHAGAVALAIMLTLLFTARYMSLATMCAVISTPFTLVIGGYAGAGAVLMCALQAAFIVVRHRGNISRLMKKEESKFYLRSKNAA